MRQNKKTVIFKIIAIISESTRQGTRLRVDISKELEPWINESGLSTERKRDRTVASERIVDAYNRQSTNLDIANLNLGTLPSAISRLSKLKRFKCNDSKLTELPSGLGSLSSLTTLFLRNNNLSSLPTEIGNLSSLAELHLYNNQLTTIPNSLQHIHSTATISLTGNLISQAENERIIALFPDTMTIDTSIYDPLNQGLCLSTLSLDQLLDGIRDSSH